MSILHTLWELKFQSNIFQVHQPERQLVCNNVVESALPMLMEVEHKKNRQNEIIIFHISTIESIAKKKKAKAQMSECVVTIILVQP